MKQVAVEDLITDTIDVFLNNTKKFGWVSCSKNGCMRKWYNNLTPPKKFKISSSLLDVMSKLSDNK